MDNDKELSLAEVVELERHAVQTLIDTFEELGINANGLYKARERLESLYIRAARGSIDVRRLFDEIEAIRTAIEAESN